MLNPRPLAFLCLVALGTAALAQAPAPATGKPQRELKGYDPNGGRGKRLIEVPIDGDIDLGLASFVERSLNNAEAGDVVLLKIKTFGGRVDAAVRIRDALLDAKATTVAYIDHRAISAGALIALAVDTIIMSPGASMGAATPVELGEGGEMKATSEKVVSYMRAEMRATAEAKGRRADLAEAMVDADLAVAGVIEKGKLLTLTGTRAVELGLADAAAPTFEDAIALLNLGGAERQSMQTHWGEKVARFLTDPVVSSLLMSIGLLGLMLEFYTGGHGIGGAIGVVCLALFFFGQYAANLAGWEEFILFGVGVGLIVLEIFVIPGFGFAGFLGVVAMAAALVMALVDFNLPWDVSFELGYVQQAAEQAAVRLATVIVVLVVGTVLISRYVPRTTLGQSLILGSATAAAQGFVGTADSQYQDLVGKTGRAVGMLRPAGIVDFDGRRVDVVSEGEYVEGGSVVKVLAVDGNRVVVRKVEVVS